MIDSYMPFSVITRLYLFFCLNLFTANTMMIQRDRSSMRTPNTAVEEMMMYVSLILPVGGGGGGRDIGLFH